MATLYIAEFTESAFGQIAGHAPVAALPAVTEQTVAISGASAQSSAFGNQTEIIRVHTDTTCSILVGTNPTATAAKLRMVADQTEYFAVQPGDKIAVITNP